MARGLGGAPCPAPLLPDAATSESSIRCVSFNRRRRPFRTRSRSDSVSHSYGNNPSNCPFLHFFCREMSRDLHLLLPRRP